MTPPLSLLTSIVSLILTAGEPSCVDGDPNDCRVALTPGDPAPFAGQLLTPRRAARLAVAAGQCEVRTSHAVEAAIAEMTIDLRLERALRAQDRESYEERSRHLTAALEKAHAASERGFFDHPVTWITVGVLLTTGGIVGSVALISETRPAVVTTP